MASLSGLCMIIKSASGYALRKASIFIRCALHFSKNLLFSIPARNVILKATILTEVYHFRFIIVLKRFLGALMNKGKNSTN